MRDLRRKAADLIIDRIKHPKPDQDPITITKASEDLGVSRQAIYDFLKRRYCPSLALIHRACEVWGLKFDFRGMLIESSVFTRQEIVAAERPLEPPQLSLELVEAIRQINYRNVEVIEAKPAGRTVEIILRLTIPA